MVAVKLFGQYTPGMSCARGCCATYAEHVGSLVMGGVTQHSDSDRTLSADRDAYKRMRDEGLQPHSLKGSANLEKRAESKWEIESGRILPPDQQKRIDSAVVEAAQATA